MPIEKSTTALKTNLTSLGFFVFCAACFFGMGITHGFVLAPEDDLVQNYPAFACGGSLWTPLLLSGFPLLADPQVQFFYPLLWLVRNLPLGGELTTNFNLYIISAFVLAGFFAALLARKLTGSYFAGLMAGLCYAFSGFFVSELKHVQILHTALWLPLLLYLLEAIRENSCSRAKALPYLGRLFALSLAVACTIFAGHPQTALYVLATVVAYAGVLSLSPFRSSAVAESSSSSSSLSSLPEASSSAEVPLVVPSAIACDAPAAVPDAVPDAVPTAINSQSPSLPAQLRQTGETNNLYLIAILVAVLAGVAISAVQLLPSLELSSFSARTTFSFKDFVVGQVEPMQIVGFSFPYILGGAYGVLGNMPFAEQGPPPGLLFFGFAPLFLASYAMGRKDDLKLRIWFFFALIVLAFLLSLGDHMPLSRLVYWLPFFGSFRGLYRVLILLTLGVSMLCAIGVARLEEEFLSQPPLRESLDLDQLKPSKHVYILIFLVISCFSYPFFLGVLPLIFFLFKFPRLPVLYSKESKARQKILVCATFAVLATYGVSAEWTKASPVVSDFKPPAIARTYGAETAASHTRIFTVKGLEGKREQLPPNLSRLWGVASATGYEPLVSRRYSRLLGISEGGFLQPPWLLKGCNRAFDVTAVKYLFAPWGEFDERAFDDESKAIWKLKQAADATLVYENARVMPRFYIVPQGIILPAEKIYLSIINGRLPDGKEFDPRQFVLLESHRPEDKSKGQISQDNQAIQGCGQILESHLSDERLTFKVSLKKSGYFVLADMYYPGWRVWVDKQPAEILPANYVQRAVKLTSGDHIIVFEYRPDSLIRGAGLTLVVLAGWCLLLLGGMVVKLLAKA